ncbi:hypothetical protein GGP68_002576 [Salinibacter ruber]|uniref:Uncharacterized protein n=1 Tax=Salinibacter ruber TaxID=146919 RepID=A0A9X2Q7M1_9BACT|nr:hypothetical protein [Salinibacter ruber]MCS3710946.1 hypothetical protein [Salinibacter ruber]
MDAQYTLVRIYLFVCRHYRGRLAATVQRQSNNDQPDFTDEEVLTIYLFGLAKKRETISEIHEQVEDHFSEWFPDLPSYQSYNRRLNRLNAVFSRLSRRSWRRSMAGDSERNRYPTGLEGALLPRTSCARVRSARCCNADSCSQPLIRIYE